MTPPRQPSLVRQKQISPVHLKPSFAFAAAAKCDFLITCDDELLEKKHKIERFLLSEKINTEINHPFEYWKK